MKTEFSQSALLGKSSAELEEIYDKALGKLPSRAPIYLPTERVSLVDRIIGVEHVRQIYQQDLDKTYRPKLRALREKYKDKERCFLIGNGPSLNKTDLDVLKDEVTFAVNGFFLKARDLDWKPTFYLVEDHLVAEDRALWVNQFKGPTKLFPAYLGYVFPDGEDTIFYNHRPRKSYPHGFDFSIEADKITYTGCTVTFSMMQIAAYLGFKEIYLIGVDASYDIPKDAQEGKDYSVGVLDMKSDDPNHFDPNYFGKGFRWHDPQVQMMIEAYQEARRSLEGTPQTIMNATVGGMLEVFERRSFHDIFPHARSPEDVEAANTALNAQKYPKLVVFDMTAMGNGSATGDVKANLLDGWPKDRLLQVARHGKDGLALVRQGEDGNFATTPVSERDAEQAVKAFDAEAILYRPVPKVPWLHDFATRMIKSSNLPTISWIMDDWPAELEVSDPEQWASLEPDLKDLLSRSAVNLSICDKMSDAFKLRYGVEFRAFANGVNPVQWPALRHHEGRALKIRYSGGLAQNMTLDSVLRVARVVEKLADSGLEVSFEITTQPWWHRQSAKLFEPFKHTIIETMDRDAEAYREWLCGADVALIAYNFDEETLRYVRYSMANKMPECLASGAVVLCHSPRGIATIDYLASTGAAKIVEEQSDDAVEKAILSLANAPEQRNALARKARDVAFERHNIMKLREELRATIQTATRGDAPAAAFAPLADLVADPVSVAGEASSPAQPVTGANGTTSPLDIAQALTGWDDPKTVLIAASGYLLLDPANTLRAFKVDKEVSNALAQALTDIDPNDAVRLHFDKVLNRSKRLELH